MSDTYVVEVTVKIPLDNRDLIFVETYLADDPNIEYISLDESVIIEEVSNKKINEYEYNILSHYINSAFPTYKNYMDINGEPLEESTVTQYLGD